MTPPNSQSKFEKIRTVLLTIVKFIMILISLYFFVCSLTFLSDSFRLLGGKNIGGIIHILFVAQASTQINWLNSGKFWFLSVDKSWLLTVTSSIYSKTRRNSISPHKFALSSYPSINLLFVFLAFFADSELLNNPVVGVMIGKKSKLTVLTTIWINVSRSGKDQLD